MGTYSVFPTGTTVYDRDKAWNGYTVFHAFEGAVVIDMNGNVVHMWKGLNGSPSRLLPGGFMMGTVDQPVIAARFEHGAKPAIPDLSKERMLEVDWNGKVQWERHCPQHHDYQIGDNPVGYPVPGKKMKRPGGNRMLVLENCIGTTDRFPENTYIDDKIVEYDESGAAAWEWKALDHLDDFGLSTAEENAALSAGGDWIHLNSVNYIGENRFFEAGDERFAPENIIVSSRELSIIFILEKHTGKMIWRHGPAETQEELNHGADENDDYPGLIIGQHHVHIIPKGLPGEGNLLLFDNGGFSGFGEKSLTAPDGKRVLKRHYSRVLEIDPVQWKTVWSYQGSPIDVSASILFSPLLGSAQRLMNGNTLITEGVFGRIMEITPAGEVAWEYINDIPSPGEIMGSRNIVYRAYRVPYAYLPFLEQPEEVPLPRIDNFSFHVPGSVKREINGGEVVEITDL